MSPRIAAVPDPVTPAYDERLAELLDETSPQVRRARIEAGTRPVLPALEPLLPDGRLPKGVVVEALDHGLLLATAAGPAAASESHWTAIIGWPDAGLAAARAYGLPWERTLVADDPGDHWAEVASVLADACETIILKPTGRPAPRQLARLEQRLRTTGTTILTPTIWPGTAELRLTVSGSAWAGLGEGYGALQHRTVTARCTGRGRARRPREARLLLPDEQGRVSAAAPAFADAGPGAVGVAAMA
ncbi:hypothetical protein ACIQI7_32450 [Kitasatospora sp. NPDC092039]|uniref:hypothetical protein n=1 Tax=Kitasatospora sp. NPDC092039 TaxID=3364086 RepID=UPI00381F126A